MTQHGYNRWQLPVACHTHSDDNLLLAFPPTFENIFVILQQFRWAFNTFTPGANLWFGQDKQLFEATEERREKVRRSFEEAEVFVLTLGLSEIWFMWRTIPARLYERDRYICRTATVAETLASLYEFDALADRFLGGKNK